MSAGLTKLIFMDLPLFNLLASMISLALSIATLRLYSPTTSVPKLMLPTQGPFRFLLIEEQRSALAARSQMYNLNLIQASSLIYLLLSSILMNLQY